jgi:hypothetical protein
MAKIMFQFQHPGGIPTVDEICQLFGFRPAEIDEDFGVIPSDPQDNTYVILVEESARERVEARLAEGTAGSQGGFSSNPKIETFGPPKA